MDETYTTKAIILNRQPFRENDTKVILYSLDYGKLELVARGTQTIKSKIASHIEPMNLSFTMIVKGKQFDYLGSAISQFCYGNIKGDLEKLGVAGEAINIFNQLVKEGQADKDIFNLLYEYLEILNNKQNIIFDYRLLLYFFILKLLTQLGYKPELYNCVVCKKKIAPNNNSFSLSKGGIICKECSKSKGNNSERRHRFGEGSQNRA